MQEPKKKPAGSRLLVPINLPADGDPAAGTEAEGNRLRDRSSSVVKVEVDTIRREPLQSHLRILFPVIESAIETHVIELLHLLLRPRTSQNTQAGDLPQLAHDRTRGTMCTTNKENLPWFGLQDLEQAIIRSSPGHTENTQRRTRRLMVRVQREHQAGWKNCDLTPAPTATHQRPDGDLGRSCGFEHLADILAAHEPCQQLTERIRSTAIQRLQLLPNTTHPGAHIGVHGDELGLDHDLTWAQRWYRQGCYPEVLHFWEAIGNPELVNAACRSVSSSGVQLQTCQRSVFIFLWSWRHAGTIHQSDDDRDRDKSEADAPATAH
mmetsp:Transcript_69816/g.227128  ORF Transcript_69816/g.227128 Transcript_69816/m.227128 type:complete len:322 (+) Transcript_69816:700-1665(+)